uniref:Uncharacterized protein n=1 Tax=Nelumbo nucifera TaxID=4432 RepID=A0A822ZRK1_NELNU|nr:TPA_asm: hypothetical protein HUJ06_004275 [Nelumbo nucifera]
MPPFKIQPIYSHLVEESIRSDPVKPIVKSRLKRLWSGSSRVSTAKMLITMIGSQALCALDKMVRNFIEENNEKHLSAAKCGRNRCNCFHGNCSDSSNDEFDVSNVFVESSLSCTEFGPLCEFLEKNKSCKRKDDCRKVVADGLVALGYDASICKSCWEKSPILSGRYIYNMVFLQEILYGYIVAIVDGERLLIDIDFRSEFEIACSIGTHKAVLQVIPIIFVGKADHKARQSLKKKGMHFPPWRKVEYMKAKWLSPCTKATSTNTSSLVKTAESGTQSQSVMESAKKPSSGNITNDSNSSGEFELLFGENSLRETMSGASSFSSPEVGEGEGDRRERERIVKEFEGITAQGEGR